MTPPPSHANVGVQMRQIMYGATQLPVASVLEFGPKNVKQTTLIDPSITSSKRNKKGSFLNKIRSN